MANVCLTYFIYFLFFQREFHIGVAVDGYIALSGPLQLSAEDDTSHYLPRVDGLLYLKAHMPVAIPVPAEPKVTKEDKEGSTQLSKVRAFLMARNFKVSFILTWICNCTHRFSKLTYLHLPTDCFMKISSQSTGPRISRIYVYKSSPLSTLPYVIPE